MVNRSRILDSHRARHVRKLTDRTAASRTISIGRLQLASLRFDPFPDPFPAFCASFSKSRILSSRPLIELIRSSPGVRTGSPRSPARRRILRFRSVKGFCYYIRMKKDESFNKSTRHSKFFWQGSKSTHLSAQLFKNFIHNPPHAGLPFHRTLKYPPPLPQPRRLVVRSPVVRSPVVL